MIPKQGQFWWTAWTYSGIRIALMAAKNRRRESGDVLIS